MAVVVESGQRENRSMFARKQRDRAGGVGGSSKKRGGFREMKACWGVEKSESGSQRWRGGGRGWRWRSDREEE